jgi:hypothetical protein
VPEDRTLDLTLHEETGDKRRRRAVAYAGALVVFMLMVPLVIRLVWPEWPWLRLFVINVAACGALLVRLLTLEFQRLRPVNAAKDWSLFSLGCLLLAVGLLGFSYMRYERQLYERSPECLGVSGGTEASLTPCAWVPMQLVTKRFSSGGARSRSHRVFEMTDSGGTTHRVEFFRGSEVFEIAEEGDALQAQVWRGSVVRVMVGGANSPTDFYPGISGRWALIPTMALHFSGPYLCLSLFAALSRRPSRRRAGDRPISIFSR